MTPPGWTLTIDLTPAAASVLLGVAVIHALALLGAAAALCCVFGRRKGERP